MRTTGMPLEGEILGSEAPDPEARDATPGWISRNRDRIRRGQALAQALIVAAPPPARLALAAASVAAEGLLLAEDFRRGALDGRQAGARAGRIALEGVAILAATRFAPALLARQRHRLAALRANFDRLRPATCD